MHSRDLLGLTFSTILLALLPFLASSAESLRTGEIVVTSGETILRMDPMSGEQSVILGPDLFRPGGIAVGRRGTIFVADTGNAGIARVDQTTGARTLVSAVEFSPAAYPGVAIDRHGDLLVVSNRSLLRIDPETGAQTTIASDLCAALVGDCLPGGIAIGKDNGVFVSASHTEACPGCLRGPDSIASDTTPPSEPPPAILRVDAARGTVTVVSSLPFGEVRGMAVDDDGDIFVASDNEVLRVDQDTGAQEVVARVFGARDVAIDAHGFLFVVSGGDFFDPRLLRIDPADGSLISIPTPVLVGPIGIAVDDLRGDLLVTDAAGRRNLLVRIDPDSGEASVVSARQPPRLRVADVAVDKRADLLVTDSLSTSILRLEPETQRLTTLSTVGAFATDPVGLVRAPIAIGPEGQIFAIDAAEESILRIDPRTGLQTTVSSGPELIAAAGIAVRGDGDLLVTLGYYSYTPLSQILRVDQTSGARMVLSSGGPLDDPMFVGTDPTNGTALVVEDGRLVRVDPTTGTVTTVSNQIGLNGRGIVANQEGDIFVSVPGAILRVDPNTGDTQTLSEAGFLRAPFGLAIDGNGDLITADADADAVIRVDSVTGAQTRVSFGDLLRRPRDVAIHSGGDLLVVDPESAAVLRIDPRTGAQAAILLDERLDRARGIALTPNGEVLVSTAFPSAILRVDVATGAHSIVSSEGSLGFPAGIAVDADGEILVATGRVLLSVEEATGKQSIVAGGSFRSLHGIALDPDGDVIVTDFFADGVIRIDALTGLQTAYYIAPGFLGPRGVAAGSTGDIFASMSGSDSVARIDSDTGVSTLIPTVDEPVGLAIVPLAIRVDVKPGSLENVIIPRSRSVIPVAILGSDTFDVADVDVTTLAFGPNGAPLAHRNSPQLKDANHDGIDDLLAHFLTEESGIAFGDEEACVTGETLDGTPFDGCDAIRTAPTREIGCEPSAEFGQNEPMN